MNAEQASAIDPPVLDAIDELQELILARYPAAIFTVDHGEDPEGTYLRAFVDVEDVDEVIDAFGDRLLEMQIDEGLALYGIPLEPLERVLKQLRG